MPYCFQSIEHNGSPLSMSLLVQEPWGDYVAGRRPRTLWVDQTAPRSVKRRKFECHVLEKGQLDVSRSFEMFSAFEVVICCNMLWIWTIFTQQYKVWTGKTCTDMFPHNQRVSVCCIWPKRGWISNSALARLCQNHHFRMVGCTVYGQRHVFRDTSEDAWYRTPATYMLETCRKASMIEGSPSPTASDFPSPWKSQAGQVHRMGNRAVGGFSLRVSMMRSWQSFVRITSFIWEHHDLSM